jgi:uncharacterized membrane protein
MTRKMKLLDKSRIRYLILISVIGLGLSAFLIYEQTEKFGKIEIISISITALFLALLIYFLIKKENK